MGRCTAKTLGGKPVVKREKIGWIFIWTVAAIGLVLSLLFFAGVPNAQTAMMRVVNDNDDMTGRSRRFPGSSVYLNERNATAGNDAETMTITIGQSYGGSNYSLYRSYFTFDTSFLQSTIIDSAKVKIVVADDNTLDDFNFQIVQGTYTGTATADWFNDFTGWAASGAYSVTDLATAINTNTITGAGDTITFKLNAAGLAAINETGYSKFMILSSKDISATAPTQSETVIIENDSPYLQVWYKTIEGITRGTLYKNEPNYIWKSGTPTYLWKP
jgi:hypothetical protein